MYIDFDNYEYNSIVNDILSNREFKKLEGCSHHSTTRFEHSKRVSFYAYKICKRFNLDYVSAARGGLLHDFFLNSYERGNCNKLLVNHPMVALYNSKKHFKLNEKEPVFPLTKRYSLRLLGDTDAFLLLRGIYFGLHAFSMHLGLLIHNGINKGLRSRTMLHSHT